MSGGVNPLEVLRLEELVPHRSYGAHEPFVGGKPTYVEEVFGGEPAKRGVLQRTGDAALRERAYEAVHARASAAGSGALPRLEKRRFAVPEGKMHIGVSAPLRA